MLLKPWLPYWVFSLLESTYSYLVPHMESFLGKHCWVVFYKHEYVLTAVCSVHACLFGLKVHSLCSLWGTEGSTLIWISCHSGLVTLNVMYYQSNNDNKWSQHTRGQAYSQSIQTHTSKHAKCPNAAGQDQKCCQIFIWSTDRAKLLLHGIDPEEKKEYSTRFLLHCHSSASPLAIKGMIKSDKVSGKWRESRQRPQPRTLVNYSRDSKGDGVVGMEGVVITVTNSSTILDEANEWIRGQRYRECSKMNKTGTERGNRWKLRCCNIQNNESVQATAQWFDQLFNQVQKNGWKKRHKESRASKK